VLSEFARCVADRSPARVTSALSLPISIAYSRAMKNMASDECLSSGMMHFNIQLFRGALFSELWRRRVAAERKGRPWGPVLPPFDVNSPDEETYAEAQQQRELLSFGDCVVKRDRTDASDILTLPIASREQRDAYRRLIPHLDPCVSQGTQITFSKPILEGALAEALYRGSPEKPVE